MAQHPHKDIINRLVEDEDIKVECQFEKYWHRSNLVLVAGDYRGEFVFCIVDNYHEYKDDETIN